MARRNRQASSSHEPMYGWALDSYGRPIPIGAAKRGAHGYRCPICNGPMVARKGDLKQHHFAHEALYSCTPERVAAVIAGKWLILELGKHMALQKPCMVEWQLTEETYSANLLKDIAAIVENLETEHGIADVALKDADGEIKSVLEIDNADNTLVMARFASNGIAAISLPVHLFRSGQMGLAQLLKASEVRGGWALLGDKLKNFVTDPVGLRELLNKAVSQPPYQFWGKLETISSRSNVLRIGENLLWLPKEIWQVAVGGSRNRLSELDISIQEWPQADGSVVVLFYVELRNNRAIAIRRFQRGQQVHATLTAAYRIRKTTAEDVARLLATG